MNTKFFTQAFRGLSGEQLEEYHRMVFMNMEGQFASERRTEYYRGRLRHMGKEVRIGCGVKMLNPQYISLGDGVTIDDRCVLIARGEKGITLDEKVELKYGVCLDMQMEDQGSIRMGKRVYVGTGCCLYGHNGLEIGDDTLLAQNITITPYSHKFEDDSKIIFRREGSAERSALDGTAISE